MYLTLHTWWSAQKQICHLVFVRNKVVPLVLAKCLTCHLPKACHATACHHEQHIIQTPSNLLLDALYQNPSRVTIKYYNRNANTRICKSNKRSRWRDLFVWVLEAMLNPPTKTTVDVMSHTERPVGYSITVALLFWGPRAQPLELR